MSPYEITYPGGSVEHWNEEPGAIWVDRVTEIYNNVVWLNPTAERHWTYTQSIGVMKQLVNDRMPCANSSVAADAGANADQVAYWNAAAGETWVAMQDRLDRQLAPLGRAAMDALDIAADERLIDVGCGCGATSLELATEVGDDGSVLGVDISAPMLAVARQRA
eukprot:gene48058-65190_t